MRCCAFLTCSCTICFLYSFCLLSLLPTPGLVNAAEAKHQLQVPSVAGIPHSADANAPPEFGTDSAASDHTSSVDVGPNRLLIRSRRYFQERTWTGQQMIEAIFCVFIPPLSVLLHGGSDMLLHLVLNIVLWICGWMPGVIHAFWYCFYHD